MSNEAQKTQQEHYESSGYEKRDVHVKTTLIVTGIIVVFILVCLVFLDDLFVLTKESMYADMALKPVSNSLTELRAAEAEALTTYKLLDPQKGIYRIPIGRAMELIVSEASRAQSGSVSR